jgi:phosphoglycerate dehydrogenase-like enzyme
MAANRIAILYNADPMVNPVDILPEHERAIRIAAPDAEVVRAHEELELLDTGADAQILLTWGMYRPYELARSAKSLQWIHALSAGVDGITQVPEFSASRIRLTCTKGIHGAPIAEHTLCMMLMLTRGFHLLRDRQLQKQWRKHLQPGELEGKTAAILGVGEIGRVIARKCKLMGMRVFGLATRPSQEPSLDRFYRAQDLLTMLPEADYVVVAVPLTPETAGWIGEKQLRAMKKTAYLFNVARGPVIDTASLIRALEEGWIAGAGLDTVEPEPLPPMSHLWSLPNVLISPHMAADSPNYMHRAIKVFCENLSRFNRGEPLLFEFDWEAGF